MTACWPDVDHVQSVRQDSDTRQLQVLDRILSLCSGSDCRLRSSFLLTQTYPLVNLLAVSIHMIGPGHWFRLLTCFARYFNGCLLSVLVPFAWTEYFGYDSVSVGLPKVTKLQLLLLTDDFEYCCPWLVVQFSVLMRQLFEEYNNVVSTGSVEDFCRTVLAWLEQHCSLPALRPGKYQSSHLLLHQYTT